MFNVGDYVFDIIKNKRVQILDRYKVWGFVSYKVFNPSEDVVYKLSQDQISSSVKEQNTDLNYLRYITLLSRIKNEIATGILSNLSSGIIPLPHQIHVLNRAVSNNNIRYILADEVGLGKTIEAGLIIKELKTRGLIKRVLIVCPKGLVTQWGLEMGEKFGEKFHVILPEDYEQSVRLPIAKMSMVNLTKLYPLWIQSSRLKKELAGARKKSKAITKNEFSLLSTADGI